MYIGLHVKYYYFCQIWIKLEYSAQFFSNNEYELSCKFDQCELFHVDEQRDGPLRDSYEEANRQFSLTGLNIKLHYGHKVTKGRTSLTSNP